MAIAKLGGEGQWHTQKRTAGSDSRGTTFDQTYDVDGRVVSRLDIWFGSDRLTGVQLTLSDGTVGQLIGSASGAQHTFTLTDGERIAVLDVNDPAGL